MTPFPLASRRNKKKRTVTLAVFGATVIGLCIAALGVHTSGAYRQTHIASSLLVLANAAEDVSDSATHVLVSKSSLLQENEELKQKIQALEGTLASTRVLQAENSELKTMLGRFPKATNHVLAFVIARPMQTPYDTLVLDEGSESDIKVGDLVVADGTYAIGRVAEVAPSFATVTLFTTPKEETAALLGTAHLAVTLVGRGGGNFTLELPRDTVLVPDEYALMEDDHTYLVGDMLKELSDPRDPIKTVIMRSPVSLWRLSWVEVITHS